MGSIVICSPVNEEKAAATRLRNLLLRRNRQPSQGVALTLHDRPQMRRRRIIVANFSRPQGKCELAYSPQACGGSGCCAELYVSPWCPHASTCACSGEPIETYRGCISLGLRWTCSHLQALSIGTGVYVTRLRANWSTPKYRKSGNHRSRIGRLREGRRDS